MPRVKNALVVVDGAQPVDTTCRGGASFMCKKASETAGDESRCLGPHERKGPVWCRKCDKYMGCAICAQPIQELVCNICRDWASDEGERQHGRMLNKDLALVKIQSMIDKLPGKAAKQMPPAAPWEIEEEKTFLSGGARIEPARDEGGR